ncbi:NAD+ synthetase [Idiomarina sp. A28L]|uniref:NAD+ synthase n=1 Tax=Idiomarina sp. A28L TaxID=1036674 RepID=UPI00021388A5|nr:NAD+ synthase [Idiomarina sp. A28L]EGN75149.1 NAD+ synthetase [Idiomarina sp. A28L]
MHLPLNITLAQLNLTVGAIQANKEKILATIAEHQDSDLIVFPELAITGYPPEDLLYRPDLYQVVSAALDEICAATTNVAVAIGFPQTDGVTFWNALSVFSEQREIATYHKRKLPNYGVFDEHRYFTAGSKPVVVELQGVRIGLLICEDLWSPEAARETREAGAQIMVSVNASPFEEYKYSQRLQVLSARCKETQLPLVYVNTVGGQDEVVFDGNSVVLNADGEVAVHLPHCEEAVVTAHFQGMQAVKQTLPSNLDNSASIYQALVLALRDYVQKNGFPSVLLGLSGGIDSALTLALAVDALGGDRVRAVMMPYRYTADISVADAEEQAQTLGCEFDIVPIEPMVESFMATLTPLFGDTERDTTEENLQARCRGVLLMGLSNKHGSLLLTTGNKSELAVGYCTLYGDMCGGFAPIKDLPKSLVYQLSIYRNSLNSAEQPAIPERVITRAPSAELAPDQKDQDSLPPYDVLDEIIDGYAERDLSIADLVALGYSEEVVKDIIRKIERNEYKRRQGAVGPKVTRRNFNKDRRYPITNHYVHTLMHSFASNKG